MGCHDIVSGISSYLANTKLEFSLSSAFDDSYLCCYRLKGSTAGAIDVVAVRDSAGILSCSPFHVKLNKAAKRGDSCRIVKLTVNSKDVALSMKLGGAGEAFFVERTNHKVYQNDAAPSVANSNSMPFSPGNAPDGKPFHVPPFVFDSSTVSTAPSIVDPIKLDINDGRLIERSISYLKSIKSFSVSS